MRPELSAAARLAFPFSERSHFSPLVLADRLLTLAQEADRAGLRDCAARLLGLIDVVLEEPPTFAAAA